MKNALTKTILIALLCLYSTLPAMAQVTIGVKPGQYIKYNISVSVMGATIQGTMKMTFETINPPYVSGTIEISVTGYPQVQPTSFTINVGTGTGSTGMPATGIIPANLTIGQQIPGIAKTVEGLADHAAAGATRRCVYATGTISGYGITGMTGTFYWDQQTGVLVEVSGQMSYMGYSYSYKFEAVETNMWAPGFGLSSWLWIIIAVVVVVAVVGVAVFLIRKRKAPATQPPPPTTPTAPPPSPPAPPPPTSLCTHQ